MSYPAVAAVLSCLLLLSVPQAGASEPSAARRVGADLAVLLGDVRQLSDPATLAVHQAGFRARILGGLAPLGLLVREAREERGTSGGGAVPLAAIRQALQDNDLVFLRARLIELALEFPLDGAPIVTAAPTEARLARGRQIYEALCVGCHATASEDGPLPARDLFRQSATMPAEEFAARLIGGLRGTPATALDNPFSMADLAAVYAFLRHGSNE